MRAQITLLSGAQIDFDIDNLTTNKNRVSEALTSMEWSTPSEWTKKLHTITLSQIAAVVILDD